MGSAADRLSLLQTFDLSENQARVYLALLDYPAVGAGVLAKATRVPRNRLYELLEELNALGLVDIVLDEPRKYRARPLESYLDRRVGSLQSRIEEISARRELAAAAFQPRSGESVGEAETGTTRILLGRGAVAQEIERLLGAAQTSVLAMASVPGAMRLSRHLASAPPAAAVRVELVFAPGADVSGLSAGYDVRFLDTAPSAMLIVRDDEELLLVHPAPDDDRLTQGRDYALLTDNPAFVRDLARLARVAPARLSIVTPP